MDREPNSSSKPQLLSPILGLPVDMPKPAEATKTEPDPRVTLELSVIIPARNEEANLPTCLASLLVQDGEFFKLGKDWELIVIDDASTDSTYSLATELASQYPEGVRVLEAPALELHGARRAFTGKTNACWFGAQQSHGRWLLFTDADTLHEQGNLIHALHEAKKHNAALLSYSPKQIVHGFWQRALMPLIFSELASVYPPAQVNDPAQRVAAANGQFLLVERDAYFSVGGHRTVGRSVLEDVDLAYNIKRAGVRNGNRGLRFRYAPDALSTRMYRGFSDMAEGWTKNLALLFPHALALAAWRTLDIVLLLLPLLLSFFPNWIFYQRAAVMLLWARNLWRVYARIARSHFGFFNDAISVLALPLFIALLIRSWMQHRLFHRVAWKGREYRS